MGSYWKSMAAEVLPSWLKNLRARRRTGLMQVPLGQGPDVARPTGTGEAEDASRTAPGPGTPEYKRR